MLPSLVNYGKRVFEQRVWIASVVFVVLAAATVRKVASSDLQHDFRTYYYAVQAYRQNLNPYELTALSTVAPVEIRFPFLYPPVALLVFQPLALVEYRFASGVFLAMKVAALAALTFLWYRYFTSTVPERVLLFFLLALGFNGTVFRDLTTGNISLFEQMVLWSAFLFLFRGKEMLFAAFFFLATLMKPLTLLLFLPLAVVLRRKALKPAGLIALLFLLTHGISTMLDPGLMHEFIAHARLPQERLVSNPSLLETMRVVAQMHPEIQQTLGPHAVLILYAVFAQGILLAGIRVLSRLELRSGVMGAMVIYALIAPRFKDYSYILLVLPCIDVLLRVVQSRIMQMVGILLVCTSFAVYQPFLSALYLFAMLMIYSHSPSPYEPAGAVR